MSSTRRPFRACSTALRTRGSGSSDRRGSGAWPVGLSHRRRFRRRVGCRRRYADASGRGRARHRSRWTGRLELPPEARTHLTRDPPGGHVDRECAPRWLPSASTTGVRRARRSPRGAQAGAGMTRVTSVHEACRF
jgi:hypothetical protein